jgi:hypothetical protein
LHIPVDGYLEAARRWPEIRRCESNRSSKNRPISIKESPTHLSGTLPQKGGP